MIKVIKNATLEKPRKMYFKTTCQTCESEFVFDSEDATIYIRKLFSNGIHIHDNRAVACPVCNALTSYFLYNNTKFLSDNKSLTEISEEEYKKLIGDNND